MPAVTTYHEVDAKSITRVPGIGDPWFLARYGMNLYRGCEHACLYCDGRAERYYVAGDFAQDIQVKRNALLLLERELARVREPGFVMLGGGVGDAYQPAEAHYRLARGALELALRAGLPVHVLTKSALVERDFDLLARIGAAGGAVLSFSIQTDDDAIRERFEPRAAPLAERWRLLVEARRLGLGTGVMAMPVLPGISDQPEAVERLVAAAARAQVNFVCFGGLTLRPGVQRETYLAAIRASHPQLLDGYAKAYRVPRTSGTPDSRYLARVNQRFRSALRHHGLPGRMPRRLFHGRIPVYTEVAVLLEHRAFVAGEKNTWTSPLARAGQAIQGWARDRFARTSRRRDVGWRDIENEFQSLVSDGGIVSAAGLDESVLPAVRELLAGPAIAV